MMEIPNARLADRSAWCFNSSLVEVDGRRLLFYRYAPDRRNLVTRLAFAELGEDYRPIGAPVPLDLPAEGPHVVSFEDPRAIAWRGETWLFHVQAAFRDRVWSAATVVTRLGPGGEVLDQHVPDLGRNRTAAVCDGPPGIDRNWSPFVWEGDLYVVYEIAPLTVYRFDPRDASWELVCREPWDTGYPTYLSGGTPLLHWNDDELVGLFHTYEKPDPATRIYAMGFYSLDPYRWRVERISPRPMLAGWNDPFKELRNGRLRLPLPFRKRRDSWRVVFPAGLAWDDSDALVVSLGWNDCRTYLKRYTRDEVEKELAATPSRARRRRIEPGSVLAEGEARSGVSPSSRPRRSVLGRSAGVGAVDLPA